MECRGYHHVDEQGSGIVDRCELQRLFGVEVCVHAALAVSGGSGESADAQSVEALDGRQTHRRVEDELPRAFAVGSSPSRPDFRCFGHRIFTRQ